MVDVTRVIPTKRSLKAANNTEISMKGEMELWIKIDGFSKLASVLISDHVSKIILGLDWLANNKVSWKFYEVRIIVGSKNRIPKLVTKDRQMDDCAKFTPVWKCKNSGTSGIRYCVCSKARQVNSGVYVARTLLSMKYDGQCIRVLNLNYEPSLFKQGTRLSDLLGATVKNKLDQRPQQENPANVKTIINEFTRDAPKNEDSGSKKIVSCPSRQQASLYRREEGKERDRPDGARRN
ncbi:hypothetical protein HELRODRAFT_162990 [Helobdella robusta]|uniref:Uncharacterized protein n=1 Tax=Helobdella robusta TaxID=6412 RepID=T1ETI2_HELRO|nr:hypothetical protein HELRODRAFT_162990 [Helobdella robusta]ESN99441.1 hypothetical protein HELRODRAFT_162990 [Helobdella robusta]